MNSKKYASMNMHELDMEIQRMKKKLNEIKSDISILESLIIACEVRENQKNGLLQNANYNTE